MILFTHNWHRVFGKVYKLRQIWGNWAYGTIYTGNVAHKNSRKQGKKEHPVGLPRDVQYYWRRRSIPSPRRWRGCGAFLTVLLHYVCKTYSLSNPRHYRGFTGFEPRFRHKNKTPTMGRLIFVAETKGFEPLIPLRVYHISNVAH